MIIEEVRPIIVENMGDIFDSHDFIREFKLRNRNPYDEMVEKCGSVASAHGIISIFLSNHANALGIEKYGKIPSENINGKIGSCTNWRKIR